MKLLNLKRHSFNCGQFMYKEHHLVAENSLAATLGLTK